MFLFTTFLILLISLNEGDELLRSKTYNIRKDLTEHCRRGVALSVFLGTHVSEASSQVLQFGKAVLPYSCFIAARTEAGNNIILVMQGMQDDQLKQACKDDAKQIVVYEIHDTFGGYWGEMPAFVRHPEPLPTNVYTLETTPTTTQTETDYEDSSEIEETTTETVSSSTRLKMTQDTIAIEIPIVNISGHFIDPLMSFKDLFGRRTSIEDRYTRYFQYQTTMIPVVEFSAQETRRENLYDMEYNINPIEQRLTSAKSTRPTHFWHLFKKTTHFKIASSTLTEHTKTITSKSNYPAKLSATLITTTKTTTSILTSHSTSKPSTEVKTTYDPYKISTTTKEMPFYYNSDNVYEISSTPTGNEDDGLYVLSDLDFEFGPYNNSGRRRGSVNKIDNVGNREELISQVPPFRVDSTTPSMMVIAIPDIEKNVSQTNTSVTQSLAGRETWENLVLAAPKMANILNKSSVNENEVILDLDPSLEGVTMLDKSKRDKRYLQGISVMNMMPRPVTSELSFDVIKTESFNYLEIEVEEFGKSVERINEKAQSRVALRYPHKYLGKELYNLCDHKDLQTRHIFMFNSSRIWIKISNFSMDTMSIVLTEARNVLGTDAFCEPDYLECQLTGTRVCIDALNACDGVPNCGAYDIYDEDRLKCGYTPGTQQSVCVAAFAFLVLAHTVIYIITYWMKRCVPKVSKAFFIYSEGAENMLNLHSIMKSPYFEETIDSENSLNELNFEEILPSIQNKKVSIYQIVRDSIKELWRCKSWKKADKNEKGDDKKMELSNQEFFNTAKYYEDTGVQTSIDMQTFFDNTIDDDEADELKILKFCRDAKRYETQMQIEPTLTTDIRKESENLPKRPNFDKPKVKRDSLEIKRESVSPKYMQKQDTTNMQRTKQILDIEESEDSILITTTADIHPHYDKRLRFDEVAITIKNSEEIGAQRFGTEKLDLKDDIELEDEPGTSKQTKLFWLGKKKKKPTGLPLSRPRSNK